LVCGFSLMNCIKTSREIRLGFFWFIACLFLWMHNYVQHLSGIEKQCLGTLQKIYGNAINNFYSKLCFYSSIIWYIDFNQNNISDDSLKVFLLETFLLTLYFHLILWFRAIKYFAENAYKKKFIFEIYWLPSKWKKF
jgi:hypothetical protein